MLKTKLNKEAWSKLADEIKELYKANGDDYILDTDDGAELRSSLDAVRNELKEAKARNVELAKEATELKKAGGDFTAIEESYKTKLAKAETQLADANGQLTKVREDSTLGVKARELATKHFTIPSLMESQLRARMELDSRDHTTIRYKDKDGKLSALTEADIIKEFVDNAEFKPIVIANRASGGAGNGSNPGGAGNPPFTPPVSNDGKPKLLSEMTPAEMVGHLHAKKAEAGQAT